VCHQGVTDRAKWARDAILRDEPFRRRGARREVVQGTVQRDGCDIFTTGIHLAAGGDAPGPRGDPHLEMRGATFRNEGRHLAGSSRFCAVACGVPKSGGGKFDRWQGHARLVAPPFLLGCTLGSDRVHPLGRSAAAGIPISGSPVFNPSRPSDRLVESLVAIAHTPIPVTCVPHSGGAHPCFRSMAPTVPIGGGHFRSVAPLIPIACGRPCERWLCGGVGRRHGAPAQSKREAGGQADAGRRHHFS